MIRLFTNLLIKYIKNATLTEQDRYLSQSKDLVDFELRQKKLMYGEAPHQISNKLWLRSHTYN